MQKNAGTEIYKPVLVFVVSIQVVIQFQNNAQIVQSDGHMLPNEG